MAGEPEAPALAVVIGATGGIGGALLQALQAQPGITALGLGRASAPPVDLADEASIAAAAVHVAGLQTPLHLMIDATGFLHGDGHMPEKGWRQLDPVHMARSFALNAIGPGLLMKHFLPLFPRTGRAVFATLSARVGSIGDNRLGGWYSYRAAKAALNQLVRTAAIELARQRPEAILVSIHPGTVVTPLSAPFARDSADLQEPADAARRILAVLDGLGPGDSGGFFSYRGHTLPW